MNLITVTFKHDLHNLLYQAYSLKKNWLGKKEWIIVSEDGDVTYNFVKDRIIPVMEDWNIILENAPSMAATNGWWRQQICKLWAAAVINQHEHSIILDSKNSLINPIGPDWFFVDRKTKVVTWKKEWGLELGKHYIDCCNFFGGDIDKKIYCSSGTPWVWRKDIVQKTIQEYLSRGCNIYNEEILPAWEFDAYWHFAQDLIEYIHVDVNTLEQGIWHYDNDPSPEYSISCINNDFDKFPFWTFHRVMTIHPTCVKFNNELLLKLKIIDESLIKEWTSLCLN
jgi:hypothetical protein